MENVLNYLSSEKVVSFNLSDNNLEVIVKEECDGWFNVNLNKSQLLQLINELTDIHSQMIT